MAERTPKLSLLLTRAEAVLVLEAINDGRLADVYSRLQALIERADREKEHQKEVRRNLKKA